MTDLATPLGCPYVGLQPYTEADIDYFFGRERDQRIIAANLGAARLTILYGASGVGKSSVLLAGVVPSLRARPRTAVAVVRDWRGPNFIDALKSESREAVERVLQESPSIDTALPLDEFLEAAEQALRGSLLIIFDQFEEYFLYHPESETGQTFDAEFARAVNRDDVDASFLIVMREDGLAKLDRFGGRIPNLLGNTLRLQHLTAADAEAAIRKPLDVFNQRHATAAPIAIEDALVDAIIDQVRSGQVALSRSGGVGQAGGSDETAQIEAPFLQLVMTRLWDEEVNSGSRALRLATLMRLGGAEQIVRMHLGGVMDSLDGARQEVCAKFFDRLVTPSGAKIACAIKDLTEWAGPNSGEVAPILETLCASRILRGVAIPGAKRQSDTSYEIYNDVIAPAILDWRRGYLQAHERAEADRRVAEQVAYANRLRIRSYALIVLGSIIVVGLGLWVYQLQVQRAALELQRAALGRQAHALELVAAAQNNLVGDPALGTLLAIEAAKATYSADGSVIDAAAAVLQHIVHTPHAAKRLLGLGGTARSMYFSPDGNRLVATALRHKTGAKWLPTTVIWDVASASRVLTIADEKPVTALAFSPNGHQVAAAGLDGSVTVLDAGSGKEVFTVAHNKVVTAAVFSPDGQRLFTAGSDGNAKISDAGSGSELVSLDGQGDKITALAYSPDAKWLAVASQDQSVTVRDATTGTEAFKRSLPGQSVVLILMFNANGNRLAALRRENATIWEVPSGKSSTLDGQYDWVAFSQDRNLLASAGQDGSVHLWDVESVENVKSLGTLLGHADRVWHVAFSPDSSRIASASADGTARVWDVRSRKEVLSLRGAETSVNKVAFGPDGMQLATAGHDGTVSVWNVGSHAAKLFRVAFSADGHQLATSGDDGTVKIWDADTRRALLPPLRSQSGLVFGLSFTPDRGRLVTATRDGQETVWDLKTGLPIFDFWTHQTESIDIVLSNDAKSLVIAGGRGDGPRAKVWDLEGHFSRAFGGSEPAAAVALSGDGRHLATVSSPDRERLEIWEEGTGSSWPISGKGLDSGKDVTFQDVVLSHNGQYVATLSENGLMQLWDSYSRKPLPLHAADLGNESASVNSGLAFSPDGTHLATAHAKTVEIWDIANKGNAKFFDVEDVNALAFSGDGKRLATASRDGTFRVWSVTPEDLIARAQALATRSLSENECKRYHVEPCPGSK